MMRGDCTGMAREFNHWLHQEMRRSLCRNRPNGIPVPEFETVKVIVREKLHVQEALVKLGS